MSFGAQTHKLRCSNAQSEEPTSWRCCGICRGRWGASRRPAGEGEAGAIREDLQPVWGRLLLHPWHRHLPEARRVCACPGRIQRGGRRRCRRHQRGRGRPGAVHARPHQRHQLPHPRRGVVGRTPADRIRRAAHLFTHRHSDDDPGRYRGWRRVLGPRFHPVRRLHGRQGAIILRPLHLLGRLHVRHRAGGRQHRHPRSAAVGLYVRLRQRPLRHPLAGKPGWAPAHTGGGRHGSGLLRCQRRGRWRYRLRTECRQRLPRARRRGQPTR
jgi:hypothetical protein